MKQKDTTQVGCKLIRGKAKKVSNVKSKTTQKIIKDLIDSMRHHDLVGMAAPQIGKDARVFVSEIRETKLRKGDSVKDADKLRIYVNPKLVWSSKDKVSGWEGCGSVAFANLFGKVKRSKQITVQALDENGDEFTINAQKLLARVVQHELDHLNGVVFTDTADPKTFMSQNEYLKKFAKK